MEVDQSWPSITFDEVSMDRSKSFVSALQELKNLRPQLYSAADYCEKSYVHSEEKQMVLDNLRDYTIQALVNAVDHLGTVAYKLTDLIDQQTLDVSAVDVKITCINQQLMTCQTYTAKEGLRQQQLLEITPRHHKHYILPNSMNKKVHFSPQVQTDPRQLVQVRSLFPSGTPAEKTLSWHLSAENKSTLKGSRTLRSPDVSKAPAKASVKFNLFDGDVMRSKYSASRSPLPGLGPASSVAIQTLGVLKQDNMEAGKLTPFRSFGNQSKEESVRVPSRSKSLLSGFFVKHKTMKMKSSPVS